ncbi:MAG: hypothetical protein KAS76_04225 [Thermoplasmatales archaeon]|jgi:hypothetical protein|nr:hypothetical protein [Thermoplasmatales archaeon]MCK5636211.1 hypothetical protein [Thermoplasmatales archaeon]
MKYGIIVCPKCKSAKGVILTNKTTKCNRCSKTLVFEKMRILYKTDSQQKLRSSLGLVNAEIDGKLKKFKRQLK